MIVTEKEAAQKWCPLARVVSGKRDHFGDAEMFQGSRPANMIAVGDSHEDLFSIGTCIGSRCMAWRQLHASYFSDHTVRGYCGAFGKVEP